MDEASFAIVGVGPLETGTMGKVGESSCAALGIALGSLESMVGANN